MKNQLILLAAASLTFTFGLAQNVININFPINFLTKDEISQLPEPTIQAKTYQVVSIQEEQVFQSLQGLSYREGELNGFIAKVFFPMPDGTLKEFTLKRNQTMHPELNQRFPELLSGDAYATDASGAFGKWDITPQGFHAMIFVPGESTVFIDPYTFGETENYIVYHKKDFFTNKLMTCGVTGWSNVEEDKTNAVDKSFGSCDLRTYRLALTATAEYTAFQGGTVDLALAAQVTTMNRVNGVYEKDIAITMSIVPNNDLLIFTNTATDGFTNGTPELMIGQNQIKADNVIGSANYDIGHVFGTNSGGLAGLGVVCSGGSKGNGVTGSSAPVGDPFDIDYVAHEMGHQFGGNHTQNNDCNSVNQARREPGSASTIMGYAGICPPNVQNNSDDYFHGYSLQEIGNEIMSNGHQCEQITALNNTPPSVNGSNANISIPMGTPFALTAYATDADGDVLTYLWEQMDNESSTQPPVATATGGPNFRSFDPTTDSTRYFPRLQSLLTNGPFTWEVLPTVSRTMDFRVVVKDNHAVGSCNDHLDVTVSTVASAGPFVLTYPSSSGIVWGVNSTQTVTWNVANTTAAPINCAFVRIMLSTDGGLTYPIELASATENDGTHTITVPNNPTTTARVMVISSAGTFFDISNSNFTINNCVPATLPTLAVVQPNCNGDAANLTVTSGDLNDSQNWIWRTGSCSGTQAGTGTSFNPTPTVTTTYFVSGSGLCSSSECASIQVVVPTAISTQITQSGTTLTAVQTNAQYQWIDCNNNNLPIDGANAQTFQSPTQIGSYAVQITQGTCTKTSPCFAVDVSGLEETEILAWTLYPNPADAFVKVEWQTQSDVVVHLTDALGKIIWTKKVQNEQGVHIPMDGLSSGLYFVRLSGEFGLVSRPIQK